MIEQSLIEKVRYQLESGLDELQLSVSDSVLEKSLEHAKLLLQWNRTINLSAIRTMDGIVSKHLLDSFAITEYVKGQYVADFGSGAGFPGIPVALAKPELNMVLVDSSSKKAQFLQHVIASLKIKNAVVLQDRIQNITVEHQFDTVTARALGSLDSIVRLSFPHLATEGCILAMKGPDVNREIEAMKMPCEASVCPISVPGLDIVRNLAILRRI